MASLLPIRFRTELARSFHRDIVSTLNVPDGELNTLNTLDSTMFTFTAVENTTTFSGDDIKGHTLAYTPGRIDVYVDGDKVSTEDFDALDRTSIVLHTATGSDTETTVELTGITFSHKRLTIPTSDVNTGTDTITYTTHGLLAGDRVVYNNGGGASAKRKNETEVASSYIYIYDM